MKESHGEFFTPWKGCGWRIPVHVGLVGILDVLSQPSDPTEEPPEGLNPSQIPTTAGTQAGKTSGCARGKQGIHSIVLRWFFHGKSFHGISSILEEPQCLEKSILDSFQELTAPSLSLSHRSFQSKHPEKIKRKINKIGLKLIKLIKNKTHPWGCRSCSPPVCLGEVSKPPSG